MSNTVSMKQNMPTPREMVAYLNQYIIGQQTAKREVANAVWRHCQGIAYKQIHEDDLGKQHTIIKGPTGCGKSYMIKLLCHWLSGYFLNLPFCTIRTNGLCRTSYVGMSMEGMGYAILANANFDKNAAERSIVILEEIDKIAAVREMSDIDVSTKSVQEALLPILDGCSLRAIERSSSDSQVTVIDTTNLLFMGTGAFVGLADIVRNRLAKRNTTHSFGFDAAFEAAKDKAKILTDDEAYSQATTENLVEYGFIPEFIGRFVNITSVNALKPEELMQLLTKKNSALDKQKNFFQSYGINLAIDEEALEVIAQEAYDKGTGARGLESVLQKKLSDLSFSLPEMADQGVCKITLTKEALIGDQPVIMELGDNQNEVEKLNSIILNNTQNFQNHSSNTGVSMNGISNTAGWSDEKIQNAIDQAMKKLDWEHTFDSARSWWIAFQNENQHRLALVLRLCEELVNRNSTVKEFFDTYVQSNCDNIQANLYYLDFIRIRDEEVRKQREAKIAVGTQQDDASGKSILDYLTQYTEEDLIDTELVEDEAEDEDYGDEDYEDDDDIFNSYLNSDD